jgi:endonuclease/exonuclease/phosphatase family metal-dependent hydrolase
MKMRHYGIRLGFGFLGGLLILGGLFVLNGLVLATRETSVVKLTGYSAKTAPSDAADTELKILAYNIAKGFIHKGGLSFSTPEAAAQRLEQIAEVIRAEQPDLVFLSEIIFECGPSPGNQVVALAEATGMHAWGFGENYNVGVPFYRIVGGNAILARVPLEPIENISLVGRQPFYVTKNNRRMLWCATQIAGQRILLAAVHTDSFNPANNLRQTQQMLEYLNGQPAILAGDFNANPPEPSIQLIEHSGQFSGAIEGSLTFPANAPDQRIDFIFAPISWTLVEHRVIQNSASDHLPVVSTFRISKAG